MRCLLLLSDVVQKYQNTVATERFKNHVLFFIILVVQFLSFDFFFIFIHFSSNTEVRFVCFNDCYHIFAFFFKFLQSPLFFIHPRADLYDGFCCPFLHQKGHFDLIKICRLVSPSVSLSVQWLVCCSVGQSISWSIGHSMPLMFIS